MKEIVELFNQSEMITDEMATTSAQRCIEKKHESVSFSQLRELAAPCKTKADYLDFLRNTMKLDAEESEKGAIVHFHKTECGCPMLPDLTIDKSQLCNCTRAKSQLTFSEIFGKEVDVQIVESFWRGGKDCVIELTL